MKKVSLVVVGAGRAGGSLARLWHRSGGVNIKAVYTRGGTSELANETGATVLTGTMTLPDADFLLISTPDASLNAVATRIAQESCFADKNNAIAFHLSGSCSSSDLTPLKDCGFKTASVHPLRSFSSSSQAEFSDTRCALEGDADTVPALQQLFEVIGARCFEINSSAKTAYHAACVISSNGLFALSDIALDAWQRAGIEPDMAREIFLSLTIGTAKNIAGSGPAESLTGPLSRGDISVVSDQLKELRSSDLSGAAVYRTLSLRLLALADPRLDRETVKHLQKLLTTPPDEI